MSTAKHTAGPWHRDRSSGARCDVRAENGRKVALCWGLSTSKAAQTNADSYRDECNANAHLIAAAPDLLGSLKDMLEAYSKPDQQICCDGHHCGCMGSTVQQMAEHYAREAIAKAEGIA
jgi:hypothetical protein